MPHVGLRQHTAHTGQMPDCLCITIKAELNLSAGVRLTRAVLPSLSESTMPPTLARRRI